MELAVAAFEGDACAGPGGALLRHQGLQGQPAYLTLRKPCHDLVYILGDLSRL